MDADQAVTRPRCGGHGEWWEAEDDDAADADIVVRCPLCDGDGRVGAARLATALRDAWAQRDAAESAARDAYQQAADAAAILDAERASGARPALVALCHELGAAIHTDAAQGIRDTVAFWRREAQDHIDVADRHASEIATLEQDVRDLRAAGLALATLAEERLGDCFLGAKECPGCPGCERDRALLDWARANWRISTRDNGTVERIDAGGES